MLRCWTVGAGWLLRVGGWRGSGATRVGDSPADLLQGPGGQGGARRRRRRPRRRRSTDQIRFCEIPAPSFKEEVRGQELKRVFQQLGLQNVRVDKVGNVLGDYPGAAPRPHLVIAAHLDTVFPEGHRRQA